jgi:lipopolysaccharide/colanic/teichoic acid biosynthesis glycosyltransferase
LITTQQLHIKRLFDIGFSLVVIPLLLFPIGILILLATLDTQQWGVFAHDRIGQAGRRFRCFKIRTYKDKPSEPHSFKFTISRFGAFLRDTKLDELPQLFHVLFGQMSFVGPRPDVPGFADALEGDDRIILKVKPGITGPATLKYYHEAGLLAAQPDPEYYAKTIIWPDKVEINKKYVESWRFSLDLTYLIQTIIHFASR